MRPPRDHELRLLARVAGHTPTGRALSELRRRRRADILDPAKLVALTSARRIVAESELAVAGLARDELAVLDEILGAHGVAPDAEVMADRDD